jgi:hypothetical protein
MPMRGKFQWLIGGMVAACLGAVLSMPVAALAAPPANNDFAAAQPLKEGSAVSAANWEATKEVGEPDHRGSKAGASVWYSWTAPRTEGAFAQVYGGPLEGERVVAVYTGDAVDALTPVAPIASDGVDDMEFRAIAGVTYRIAVDGVPTLEGPLVSVSRTPSNDDFEQAADLPAAAKLIAIGYGTVGATKQPGEPNHAGDPGGASVWFHWTAPETGSVQITTCQANFPTILAAYTGSTLAGLVPLAAGANGVQGECPLVPSGTKGQIQFNIDSGQTYSLAVDGLGGAWGAFALELVTSSERLKIPEGARPDPNTKISGIVNQRRRLARFLLRSNTGAKTFRCKLDSRIWSACGWRPVYRHLRLGRHVLRAKAVGADGATDPTPAVVRFRISPNSNALIHLGLTPID